MSLIQEAPDAKENKTLDWKGLWILCLRGKKFLYWDFPNQKMAMNFKLCCSRSFKKMNLLEKKYT